MRKMKTALKLSGLEQASFDAVAAKLPPGVIKKCTAKDLAETIRMVHIATELVKKPERPNVERLRLLAKTVVAFIQQKAA